jgi:hypothetical protein
MSEENNNTSTTMNNTITELKDNIQQNDSYININSSVKNYFHYFNSKFSNYMNFISYNINFTIPYTVVKYSNNKNLITLHFDERKYDITYTDRRLSVLLLTLSSVILHYITHRKKSHLKIRWFIPYYAFFSLFLCRENLNPY